LIADVEIDSSSNALKASLSGPLGDVCGGAAYGARLANLLKFIAAFSEWSLEASVKWKGKYLQMNLDHRSGVKSTHSRVNGSFVPPEFSQLVDAIGKESGLKAHLGDDFLDFGAEGYCFPDLIVTSEGKSFAIELFHGNHKSQIKRRLAEVKRAKTTNFLMGIDRSLLKDKAIAQVVDESDWFKSYGFDFNQFPTPSVIKKVVMRHG
jgi:predicted nuclease of restriction endonuclease-like RecB superfamily